MENLKMFCICVHNDLLPKLKLINYIPVGLGDEKFDTGWLTDKSGKNISLFAVFDIYFYKGEDFRDRIFNRNEQEKKDNKVQLSRYEKLNEIFDDLTIVNKKSLQKTME